MLCLGGFELNSRLVPLIALTLFRGFETSDQLGTQLCRFR